MAEATDVGKLRQVLDYMPCETCLDIPTPEQDYFCGICVRLNRDVVVRRSLIGTDEAVRVIPPEEFNVANEMRERLQHQESELQEARRRLAELQRREADLERRLAELQKDLETQRKAKRDDALVPFEFVGVKGGLREEPLVEFDEVDEAGTEETTFTAVPEEAPQFQPVEEEPAPAPPAPREAAPAARGSTADDAIARIEAEIAKIEEELADLGKQEQELERKASQGSRRARKKTKK